MVLVTKIYFFVALKDLLDGFQINRLVTILSSYQLPYLLKSLVHLFFLYDTYEAHYTHAYISELADAFSLLLSVGT